MFHEQLHSLGILGREVDEILCTKPVNYCPFLTRLSIHIAEDVECTVEMLKILSATVKNNKLLALERLTLKDDGGQLTGQLSALFQTSWKKLTHFHLFACHLNMNDIQGLVMAARDSNRNLFPNLTSLALNSAFHPEALDCFFTQPWRRLSSFEVCIYGMESAKVLVQAVESGRIT